MRNEVKAVVATSALGMGYDKADLTFVVHYQAPGSVVAYYQQVGRAGRAVDHADVVLLRGGEDRRIQDFFIEQAFPARERVAAVLDELEAAGEQGRTTRELMAVVNLGMGRIEAMLKILDVEGAVRRDGTRWQSVPGAEWTYDADRYEQVTALRRAEQDAMAAFGADGRCLMRVLQEELDDPDPRDCGRCSVCTSPRFAQPPDPALVELAARHLRSTPLELEVKKMAPDAAGAMRKIPEDARTERGWALARFGDGGWWPAVERGLRHGTFEDEVVAGIADILRAAGVPVAWVTSVPSASLGDVIDPARRTRRRRAWSPARGARLAHRGSPAPARDGQRRAAGRQRPRRVHGHRDATAGHRGPARRSSPLGLDNGDGRRPATPGRRPARRTTRTRDADLETSRATLATHQPPTLDNRSSHMSDQAIATLGLRRTIRPTHNKASRIEAATANTSTASEQTETAIPTKAEPCGHRRRPGPGTSASARRAAGAGAGRSLPERRQCGERAGSFADPVLTLVFTRKHHSGPGRLGLSRGSSLRMQGARRTEGCCSDAGRPMRAFQSQRCGRAGSEIANGA